MLADNLAFAVPAVIGFGALAIVGNRHWQELRTKRNAQRRYATFVRERQRCVHCGRTPAAKCPNCGSMKCRACFPDYKKHPCVKIVVEN